MNNNTVNNNTAHPDTMNDNVMDGTSVPNAFNPATLRGELAKKQLISAAIAQFGEHGQHATTRQIAAAAGQNISAIRYYFSGKDELYMACAEWIAEFFHNHFMPYATRARQLLLQPRIEKAELSQLIHNACRRLIQLMTTGETLNMSRFLSREQLNPTAAYQLIHQRVIAPMHQCLAQAIARYTARDVRDISIILHTHALVGEILAFRLSRQTLLQWAGWDDFDQQKTALICQVVDQHIDLILQGLSLNGEQNHAR